MQTGPSHDRRRHPRFDGRALRAEVRVKGQLGRLAAEVLDFNRHGVAVELDRPLPKDQLVFLSLGHERISLPRVIGVVHNCLARPTGYRCGILFRTQSKHQFDRHQVEATLTQLELELADRSAAEAAIGRAAGSAG